jgi:Kef-type K+ transport system membrane component KefB
MLLVGKLFGDLAHRIGFSPLIGQIVAGIVLGPMILNAVSQSQNLEDLSGLGILFMMFLMGLSVDFEKVMGENVYKASTISLIGGFLTFFTAMSITALLGFDMNAALLVGISFISTSTAIGFMVLLDLGDNRSNVFKTIISVGTTDDILAMLALSLFVSYMASGVDLESAFKLFLVVLGFIILVLWFGRSISEKLISVAKNSANEMSAIMMSMIILFIVAYMGEQVSAGLQVTGAFLAGTILARSQVSYKYITPKIEAISEGLFIPIFFVYTGACVNIFGMINSAPIDFIILKIPVDFVLLLGLLLVVMASKYVGTYLSGVLMGGYTDKEMHKMGLAMTPMGEYTLVISQIGLVITDHFGNHIPGAVQIYSVLAMVVLVTSIVSPIMLRKAYESNI